MSHKTVPLSDQRLARLAAQGLLHRPYATPTAAVAAFGAMQGQDLPGAIASAALRSCGNAQDVIAALNNAEIVRAYPMRGTLFIVPAQDMDWMTELCAAPALRAAQRRRDQLGLTARHFEIAREVATTVLTQPLSRAELFATWQAAGVATDGGRGYHVLAHLIGERFLVYGPWNGKDQDVVLASSWIKASHTIESKFNGDRVAATAEFLRRYLTTHGPATLRDFAWWTKLPLRQIRAAFASIEIEFVSDQAEEPSYWSPELPELCAELTAQFRQPLLLPGFDEYILGYQDRLFAMTEEVHRSLVPGNNGVFKKSVVINGEVLGTWQRGGRPGKRSLSIEEFSTFEQQTLEHLEAIFEAFPFATD